MRTAPVLLALGFLALAAMPMRAQDAGPGPLAPPTPEHDVRRIGTEPAPEAPPSLPPEEIVQRFARKEDLYLEARTHYFCRRSIRLTEFDNDGKVLGAFEMNTVPAASDDGRLYNKVVGHPSSTLRVLHVEPEDFDSLLKIPAYPLLTSQLAHYDLKYAGNEKVDEISCYIFQVKPKSVERQRAYFDGIVWVDDKYLEVVKTYGKWVNELGDMQSQELPFALFEAYRENVDGKYWFPSYARSDATIHLKDSDVSIRLVVKWSDFKPVSGIRTAPATPPAPAKP